MLNFIRRNILIILQKFKFFLLIFLVSVTNRVYTQSDTNKEDNKIRTVVIDPGHGGKDSGALGKNSMEKDIVLAIGLKLGKYLQENYPELKVIYTRKTDEFIPLYQRAEIANINKADLFISIHANSSPKPEPYGPSTHVLGLHRADENFEVAKRENSVILMEEDYSSRYENFDPNSPESYIIFSLLQNVYFDQSINFAGMVQNQFREKAKRNDRGVKQQGLLVLAQTSMPGVLIETGFISNPTEEKYLISEEGEDYLASAIFRAFRDYKNIIELRSTVTVAQNSFTDSTKSNDDSSVQIENENSTEIYFKVQLTSSSTPLGLDNILFKEFNNVEEFKVNNTFKYAVGTKTTYDEVVEYSIWVKNRFPDAFIVGVKNGQLISAQEALLEINTNPKQ